MPQTNLQRNIFAHTLQARKLFWQSTFRWFRMVYEFVLWIFSSWRKYRRRGDSARERAPTSTICSFPFTTKCLQRAYFRGSGTNWFQANASRWANEREYIFSYYFFSIDEFVTKWCSAWLIKCGEKHGNYSIEMIAHKVHGRKYTSFTRMHGIKQIEDDENKHFNKQQKDKIVSRNRLRKACVLAGIFTTRTDCYTHSHCSRCTA